MANLDVLVQDEFDNFVDFRIRVVRVEMLEDIGVAIQDRAEVRVRLSGSGYWRQPFCGFLPGFDGALFRFFLDRNFPDQLRL